LVYSYSRAKRARDGKTDALFEAEEMASTWLTFVDI
jgi:hypothetical protein